MYYHMNIAGLERDLPICPVNDSLSIAGFVIFGDQELTVACARELLKRAPEYDYIITAEAKGIPLAHEMARQAGDKKYMLARKAPKLYMRDIFSVSVHSITTAKEQKRILEAARTGGLDLLIGTHKLLGKGVQFKDLGLLIIDEEQRFGVTHKERLRQVARQVDTLTLSATPIPRTLNMAMSGIRDMSTIEQPPQDRQSVQTYVLEHDWGLLADAIRRELGRGGQVYYLHNRVDSIDATAARLRDLLGEDVAIETAHGKMAEGQLSDVMARMSEGEIDVLVCTTIIETGIDIPNVNTLIIEDADNMGLSQLHQLRGRIGRSPRRAYAYLTYRAGKVLTEVAAKRLTAIREYVEFGSGFKIAMRDLEIRGARRTAVVRCAPPPAGHRGVLRSGIGLQYRHAGPRHPRRGQSAGPGAVRLHDVRGL